MSYFKAFIFGLLGVAFLGSCSPKTLQLRLAPEANNVFTYRVTQKVDNAVSVMGMDQQTALEQVMDYEYKIQKVNTDGTVELTSSLKKMRMEQTTPMMNMVFDSENPEKNEPEEMVKGMENMLDKQFDITLNKMGEVVEVKSEEGMFKGMFGDMPQGEAMEQQMEAQFGAATMEVGLAQITGFYPEESVKVGASWTKESATDTGMSLITETTYTLKERKNGVALIEFLGKLKSDPNAQGLEMMGMTMTYDMTGTQSGTVQVDEKTGWAIRTDMLQKMGGKMNMTGGQIGEMSADMKVDGVYIYEKL